MTIQVEIEGKGIVAEFPDGTDPQVIDNSIKRDYFNEGVSAPSGPSFVERAAKSLVRPALEVGGLTAGGLLGAAAGPLGGVAGAGLGYGIGKGLADVAEGRPTTPIRDIGTGMMMEMGGQVGGKIIGKGLEYGGKFGKQLVGKVTGAGPGAAEEAVKGGKAFTDAMRGKISGEDIVENAKEALGTLKANRATAYRTKLEEIGKIKGELDTTPIGEKTIKLMERYNVKVTSDGKFDFSRATFDKKGVRDVKGALETIKNFGTQPGDKTPIGLDTLKRQLDDFYSESSNARAFVAELRNTVKDTIVKQVPEYAGMTKGYAEATKLIKDVEAGLMLRKQGMTGRVVADQTLRRLMSSMRDNFELRRELLSLLEAPAGQDLSGQVAGYTMNALLPRGLQGVGASMAGTAAALNYLNPKWVPLIVASSPRVSGEFLRMVGIVSRSVPGASMTAGKAAAYLTVPPAINLLKDE